MEPRYESTLWIALRVVLLVAETYSIISGAGDDGCEERLNKLKEREVQSL